MLAALLLAVAAGRYIAIGSMLVPVALLGAATAGLLMRALQRRTEVGAAAKHVARGRLARGTSNRGIRHAARLVASQALALPIGRYGKRRLGNLRFLRPSVTILGNEL